MAPTTKEHDEDLLFRKRERLRRGHPSTTVLKVLKRGYYLAVLSLSISYSMFQIFCELAKANLSSTQKSIKEKYNVDAVERDFKPGQKVALLVPR